jgi:hypothetical protein
VCDTRVAGGTLRTYSLDGSVAIRQKAPKSIDIDDTMV